MIIHILFHVIGVRCLSSLLRSVYMYKYMLYVHIGIAQRNYVTYLFHSNRQSLLVSNTHTRTHTYFDEMYERKYEISHLAQTKSKCEGN